MLNYKIFDLLTTYQWFCMPSHLVPCKIFVDGEKREKKEQGHCFAKQPPPHELNFRTTR